MITSFPNGYIDPGEENLILPNCQYKLFTSENNKVGFIRILSEEIEKHNYDLLKTKSDADTDIKITLLYFFNVDMRNLTMSCHSKSCHSKRKMWEKLTTIHQRLY